MAGKVADQIGYMIAKVDWHLDARRKASVGSVTLAVEQWRVLEILHERGGRSMSDLAQLAFVELPTLSKMIDRMVGDALVYRSPDAEDRRRVLIFLSDRGRACLQALLPTIKAEERAMAKRLGKTGLAALKRLSDDLGNVDQTDGLRQARPDSPHLPTLSGPQAAQVIGAARIRST